MNNSVSHGTGSLNSTLISSFIWMAIGLVVSALTSFYMYFSGAFITIATSGLSWILLLVEFGLVMAFTTMMRRLSVNGMRTLFVLYAFTLGISLTSLLYIYSYSVLGVALLVCAIYFLCLVVIGLTTKRDLSRIGTLCIGALFALIISELIMMFIGITVQNQIVSIIGLLIFTGLTAWDVQRMNVILSTDNGILSNDKWAIYFALQLYLDFINIFLYIVRILGRSSKN